MADELSDCMEKCFLPVLESASLCSLPQSHNATPTPRHQRVSAAYRPLYASPRYVTHFLDI